MIKQKYTVKVNKKCDYQLSFVQYDACQLEMPNPQRMKEAGQLYGVQLLEKRRCRHSFSINENYCKNSLCYTKANDFSLTALIFQSRATIIMRTLVHKHLYILMPIFS